MALTELLATGGAAVAIARPDPSPEPPAIGPKPGPALTVPGTPREIGPPRWKTPDQGITPPYEPPADPPYEPPADPPYEGPPEPPVEPGEPVQPIAPATPDPDVDRMLDRQLDDIIQDNADRAIGNAQGWSP
jgi:hypothetical protein